MHTPQQVATHIQGLTQKSHDLQAPAQSITMVNGPLIMVGQGPYPQIIEGLKQIVSAGTTALSQMQGMAEVPKGKDSDAIYDGFREFVRVHQELLKMLIGKAGLFSQIPMIGQPVAAVLRQDENVTDSLTFALTGNVPSRASDIQTEAKSLSDTIVACIQAHDGTGSS